MNKRMYLFLFISLSTTLVHASFEKLLTNAFECKQMFFTPSIQKTITQLQNGQPEKISSLFYTADRPLLNTYPALKSTLPWISLANVPTPITPLKSLQEKVPGLHLYLKNDGLTFQPVGGNKVRKLELLFADALAQGAQHVMTFGCAGSNHAAATAFHANKLGFTCTLFLTNQPNSPTVQNNLLIDLNWQAEILFYPSEELRKLGATHYFLQRIQEDGRPPYVIFTGGSSARGTIGYVNAAFELKEQINQGLMPEPDYIYVAAGSLGTVAGLLLGLRACGLKTKIVPVAIQRADCMASCMNLVASTNELLHSLDDSFPLFTFTPDDVPFERNFTGPSYGVVTPEAQAAINIFHDKEALELEGTYSGKAAVAFLYDIATKQELQGKVILFWNTFGIEKLTTDADAYKALPKPLHCYFTEQSKLLS